MELENEGVKIRTMIKENKDLENPMHPELIDVVSDGNCLYRAISISLYGSELFITKSSLSRSLTWKTIEKYFTRRLLRHRSAFTYHAIDNSWGDQIMFFGASLALNCKIEIEVKHFENR